MAWAKRLATTLFSEYYISNLVILGSYFFFRLKHQNDHINIKSPVNFGNESFKSLHASTFVGLEGQVGMAIVMTAVMRIYRVGSVEGMAGTVLGFAQLFVAIITIMTDPVAGIQYMVALGLVMLVFNEPSYTGKDQVINLTPETFQESCLGSSSSDIAHIVFFYASWSSRSRQMYPVYAELSNRYTTDKQVFTKLDVGAWPALAKQVGIDLSSGTSQLPTVACYTKGQETGRVPSNSKAGLRAAIKRSFTKVDLINVLELDSRYARSMPATGATPKGNKKQQ